jgi:type I restriction enzyme S subunit
VTTQYEPGFEIRSVRVRDVADSIQYGHTASAISREEGPRFLRITDIQNGAVDWDAVPSCDIPAEDIPKYRLAEGDLVFARTGATTGKSYLIRDCPDAVFASYLIRVRASKNVDPRYLAFFFQSPDYWRQVEQGKRGIGQPNVNGKVLGEIELPLRPLDEQRRIVGEIEKQFTRLDAGVASLKRVQTALKRYRASVLEAACEGRLVPTEAELARKENRSYETGEQLLQRILKGPREKWNGKGKYKEPAARDLVDLPALPEGWSWVTLEQLLSELRNGWSSKPDAVSGIPILRISAVRPMSVNLDDVRHLSGKVAQYAEYFLREGDLLFTRYNGNPTLTGVCGVVPQLAQTIVYPDKLIRVKLSTLCQPTFVCTAANVGASRQFLASRARTTAGQTGISGSDLRQMPIPLAPLAEQQRIVAEIERRLSVIREVEGATSTEHQRATRLRQSILQRAFSGRLATAPRPGNL